MTKEEIKKALYNATCICYDEVDDKFIYLDEKELKQDIDIYIEKMSIIFKWSALRYISVELKKIEIRDFTTRYKCITYELTLIFKKFEIINTTFVYYEETK